MPLSMRRMLNQEMRMFRNAAVTINLILRTTPPSTTYHGPGYLLQTDTEPSEATDTKTINIFAKFEETDAESMGDTGRERIVKGVITVPMLYKSLLAQAEFINPYNDGISRFRKVGAIVDEGRLFVTQSIASVSLQNPSDVQ